MKNLQKRGLLTPEKSLKEVPPSATSTFFGRYRRSIFADICRYVSKNVDIYADFGRYLSKNVDICVDICRYMSKNVDFCGDFGRCMSKNVDFCVDLGRYLSISVDIFSTLGLISSPKWYPCMLSFAGQAE